jgi:hypothetical protein
MVPLNLIAATMLVLCLMSWPYRYYSILRCVVPFCAMMGLLFVHVAADEKCDRTISYFFAYCLMFAYIIIMILFNPVIPIYLSRETWIPIDLISAGIFLTGIVVAW